ncbi:MAG: S8 family serine peptidase [Actinobacteria bacterium]|nr:S8 family serine peptidase [Actinomycetota bacterium]
MRTVRLLATGMLAVAALASTSTVAADPAAPGPLDPAVLEPYVVVATLDTGANPFHPAWQRDQPYHPSRFLPGYPQGSEAIDLTIDPTSFEASVAASEAELSQLGPDLAWFPGTNLVGARSAVGDSRPVFDPGGSSHGHGAQASSQIAGTELGMAPEAWVVILDRTVDGGSASDIYAANADLLRWAADQSWIDIIHTNIQNPVPLADGPNPAGYNGHPDAVEYAVERGKLVVSAGGNFYAEPTETSPHAGPRGVLAAGAVDNCGYADYSNPDPHVAMDGYGTVSAAANSFGTATFGGTSSASPRTTGYAAELLLRIRRHVGDTAGFRDGALVVLDDEANWPETGPLSDGRLTALEFHEVIRRTADPHEHDSRWDGSQVILCIPEVNPTPFAFYPKVGYGEVSEHTVGAAFDVAIGAAPMPQRPVEDALFAASEELRRLAWER